MMHLLNGSANEPDWTPEALQDVNDRFDSESPRALLAWGYETFGDDLAMATGFGPSGVVLMHIVSQLRPDATIFYLDTDLLFPETYALRDRLEETLGIRFTRVHSGVSLEEQAAEHGPELWSRAPNQCCFIRKVLPLRRFLSDKKAWITGIRRDQSAERARTPLVTWDAGNGLVKLNPLAHWSEEEVWSYIEFHDLPYNRLHDEGYPSVGCIPCTAPVAADEDPRSGRWRGHDKNECGIHLQPTGSE